MMHKPRRQKQVRLKSKAVHQWLDLRAAIMDTTIGALVQEAVLAHHGLTEAEVQAQIVEMETIMAGERGVGETRAVGHGR